MKKIVLIFCSLTLLSCSDVVVNKNHQLNVAPKMVLAITDTVSFPIDNVTKGRPRSLQYYDGKLAFLNRYANAIYIYDYKSTKLIDKIPFAPEGSDGVGHPTGFVIHSPDSIFLSSYGKRTIYLTDSTGQVKNSYELSDDDAVTFPPTPKGWTNVPMIVDSGFLIYGGSINGESINETKSNRPVMVKVDLKTEAVSYEYHYPDIYRKGNWGGALFRWINYDYLPQKEAFVFSFPACHQVFVTSKDFKQEREHYAGSQNFGPISSLGISKMTYGKKQRYKHYAITPSYGPIIYDKYRNLYYRIADLPVPEENYKFGVRDVKQLSVIVMDRDFNWLCEKKIPLYSHSDIQFFVNEKGLHLKKYNKSENYLTFSIFTPEPL